MPESPLSYLPPDVPVAVAAGVFDLSVIIVNYNVREFLEQALRSVERAAEGLAVEVFVVDNNSVDGSVEMVRACFPDVHVIANEDNVGFSKANNQAIRKAQGRYLLILNPDTIVQEDMLRTMVRFMDAHPDAGAAGCQILNPDGTFAPESRRAFPTPEVAFYRMVGLGRLFPKSRTFGRYNMTYLPRDEVAEVDALSGSCMVVRRAALYTAGLDEQKKGGGRKQENGRTAAAEKNPQSAIQNPHSGAGLFDEDFFMYGEDLDWCYRIQQAGWKIYYTPETQIIHYRGESTKKGELRYVKLFYGAMLRFAEKHLQNRYSRVFLWIVRLGVVVRASLSVIATTIRRHAVPLLDFVVLFATVLLLGLARSVQTGVEFPPLFYGALAPGYALGTAASIGALGGYRIRHRERLGPVWLGAAMGLLLIAALSFFAKEIAFSRVVVLTSFPVGAALLSVLRLRRRRRQRGIRRALVVGPAAEAARLRAMLAPHPAPPFKLVGYVASGEKPTNGTSAPSAGNGLKRLGTLQQLRDLVRVGQIDDVVFAADGLANHTIFALMSDLRDLPVQFRILAEGREHIIGKAAIEDLSTPSLIEAEAALGAPRSLGARRAFEVAMAGMGVLLHPFVALVAAFSAASSFPARLAARTRQLPAVLTGKKALIGYHAHDPPPPADVSLRPAVFSVVEALAVTAPTPEQTRRTYWLYLRNQSAALDWNIITRALRKR